LLLSATIGNAGDFASWLEEVRGVRCGVITGPGKRPVPLRSALLLPDKRLLALVDETGRVNPQVTQIVHETSNA
jgi:superfamily II RNA helicase